MDVNKIVAFDKVSYSNGKDQCYIVGYPINGTTTIPLFIKTPMNIFSYSASQYDRNSIHTMSFNVSEVLEWVIHYKSFMVKMFHICIAIQ